MDHKSSLSPACLYFRSEIRPKLNHEIQKGPGSVGSRKFVYPRPSPGPFINDPYFRQELTSGPKFSPKH